MKLYSEHTEWTGGGVNHWYLLNDSRTTMYAYRPHGKGPIVRLRTPLPFVEKGRVLKLEHDFDDINPDTVTVEGSNGNTYFVDVVRKTCSCPSYKYRGGCKHVEKL
jgi:hypothetical protein